MINLVTRDGGRVFERYDYSPFGLTRTRVDAKPPAMGQVLLRNGRLRLEFDEPIQGDELRDAVGDGRLQLERIFGDGTTEPVPVVIEQEAPWVPEIPPLEIPQGLQGVAAETEAFERPGLAELLGATVGARSASPLASGQEIHFRRLLIRPTQPLEEGVQVRLTVAADAMQDRFQNQASAAIDETFAWTSTGMQLVADRATPEVRAVRLRGNRLEIEFSEEPDVATLSAISVAAPEPPVWVLADDAVTVTTTEPLPAGERQVTIGTGLADLSGGNLAEPFGVLVRVPANLGDVQVFEVEESGVVDFSSLGNRYGFHGRPVDPESGLLYFRHRYYDPELGRFLSTDPLGYVDGPSMYGFASNSPVNYTDPLGLSSADIRLRQRDERLLNPETRDDELAMRHESQEALASGLSNPYVQGSFQVAGGCTEAFLGGLAIWTGVGTAPGAVALAHGTDLCGTGITTLVTGEAQETLFYRGATAAFERVGLDEDHARMAAIGADLLAGLYGTLGAGRAVQTGKARAIAAQPTASKVRALRALGIDRAGRRAFFEGHPVQFKLPTAGGEPTKASVQLVGGRLKVGIVSVQDLSGEGARAFFRFGTRARNLARTIGVEEVEIYGALIINDDIERMLLRQGFTRGKVTLPEELGGGKAPVLRRAYPVKR